MTKYFVVSICLSCLFGLTLMGREPSSEEPFTTEARGFPPTETPVVQPWRSVLIDPEYSGDWVVTGDLDGQPPVEVVAAQNFNRDDNHFTSAVVAQRLDGSVLWRWGDPGLGRRQLHHDVACQIHDLDNDGRNEVILAADRELIVLDGATGWCKHRFPIPEHASDCVVFVDLSGKGWRSDILVKTRYTQIWAYTAEGRLLWTVQSPGGYRTAHQPLPVDLDGDGREEILAGYAALNPDGQVRWVFEAELGKPNGGHADCWRVVRSADRPEDWRLVLTMCGGEALVLTDGLGRPLWRQTGLHYESVDVGEVRPDVPGLELVVDVDHLRTPEKPLCVFSEEGRLLGRIITDYTRHHILVDWNGDGVLEIGSALPHGLFDGFGRRVVTFAVEPDEKPMLIMEGDMDSDGAQDVLLTTHGPDGQHWVHIFRNPSGPRNTNRKLEGTGENFTLY